MSFFNTVGYLIKGIGLRRNHLLFWSVFFSVAGILAIALSNQSIQASTNFRLNSENLTSQPRVEIELMDGGKAKIGDQIIKDIVTPLSDRDKFFFVVLEDSGYYFDELTLIVKLPRAINTGKANLNIISEHGVGPPQPRKYFQDNRTLVFTGYNIGPRATFTIEATLPKGAVRFAFYKSIYPVLGTLSGSFWVFCSVALPLFTLVILSIFAAKNVSARRTLRPEVAIKSPPQNIPPAVIGVLFDGKVSVREIIATLLDLARRGYLSIFYKSGDFTFGKEKSFEAPRLAEMPPVLGKELTPSPMTSVSPPSELRDFETILLGKIFLNKSYKSTAEDIHVRVGHHIFSRKIAQVYWGIYEQATYLGYFHENPARVHIRYRFAGIILFIIGIAGFIVGIVRAANPPFLLFFWAGMILAASVVVWMSKLFHFYTSRGREALRDWLAFKMYLSAPEPTEYQPDLSQLFEKYLPYAVAMGCETEWAARFATHQFVRPEWYDSTEPVITLERFIAGLFPLMQYVGVELASSHEPTVE